MTTPGEKLLHAPEEAAGLLTIGRSQLFELIARGEIESVKIGRLRRIPHDALTAYIQRLRAGSGDAAAAG
jgi:excisionase family DNA binding protein